MGRLRDRETCKVLCDSGNYESESTGSRWLLTPDRRSDTGLGRAQGGHRLEHSAEKESETQEGWITCLMSGGRQMEGLGQAPGPRAALPLLFCVVSTLCLCYVLCVSSTCSSSSPNRALGGADRTPVQTRRRNTLHPRVHPQMLCVSGLP